MFMNMRNGHERTGRIERIGDIVSRLVAQIGVRECDGAGIAVPSAVECGDRANGRRTERPVYSATTGRENTRSADGVDE